MPLFEYEYSKPNMKMQIQIWIFIHKYQYSIPNMNIKIKIWISKTKCEYWKQDKNVQKVGAVHTNFEEAFALTMLAFSRSFSSRWTAWKLFSAFVNSLTSRSLWIRCCFWKHTSTLVSLNVKTHILWIFKTEHEYLKPNLNILIQTWIFKFKYEYSTTKYEYSKPKCVQACNFQILCVWHFELRGLHRNPSVAERL